MKLKQENPFPVTPPKAKQADPFATDKRAVRKSIANLSDFDALVEIMMSYASERKRMSDIGAVTQDEAAADIARTTKLLDKLMTNLK